MDPHFKKSPTVMKNESKRIEDYLQQAPTKQSSGLINLRETINRNLPVGFQECMSYGMIGYVVAHALYLPGYHCNPSLPLPFANVASRKNVIFLYHMGLYAIT